MTKKKILVLSLVLILAIAMIGCSKEVENNTSNGDSNELSKTDNNESKSNENLKIELTAEIEEAAKNNGISSNEMLDIIKRRIEAEANSRGKTVKEYLNLIEKNNSTPYQAVKEAADTMDMSIVDYDKMMESIKLESSEGRKLNIEDLPEDYPNKILRLLNVKEIRQISNTDTAIEVVYFSNDDFEELKKFYIEALSGSSNYKLSDYSSVVKLKGSVDEFSVKIDIADTGQVNIKLNK